MNEDDQQDAVFQALASRVRRHILDVLRTRGGGVNVGDVAQHFDVSRVAVMKHLAVLENAGLVVSRKQGRQRLLYLNAVPLQLIHERWTDQYSAYWAGRLTGLKYRLENNNKGTADGHT